MFENVKFNELLVLNLSCNFIQNIRVFKSVKFELTDLNLACNQFKGKKSSKIIDYLKERIENLQY